jgi:hypothetical protein
MGAAAHSGWRKACRCAPMSARPVAWCWTATHTQRRSLRAAIGEAQAAPNYGAGYGGGATRR